ALFGTGKLGGYLIFSWLGFLGMFLAYRAYTMAVPEGRSRSYVLLLFFLPTMLFWSSGIGKEPWMFFTLGLAAYGTARLMTGSTARGLVYAGLGIWLAALVRPPFAGIAAIAFVASVLLRRAPLGARQLAPIAKVLLLSVAVVVAALSFKTAHH